MQPIRQVQRHCPSMKEQSQRLDLAGLQECVWLRCPSSSSSNGTAPCPVPSQRGPDWHGGDGYSAPQAEVYSLAAAAMDGGPIGGADALCRARLDGRGGWAIDDRQDQPGAL